MELFVENFDMYKDIDKIDLSEILELNGDKKFPLLEKDHYYLYKTGRSDHILMNKGKVFPGVYNTKTGNFLKDTVVPIFVFGVSALIVINALRNN